MPKALIRRSAVGFLAAANAVVLLLSDIKRSVLVFVGVAFCAFAIVVSHWKPLLWLASLVVAALLVRTVYRTIRFSLAPSAFLRVQQRVIKQMVESDRMKAIARTV